MKRRTNRKALATRRVKLLDLPRVGNSTVYTTSIGKYADTPQEFTLKSIDKMMAMAVPKNTPAWVIPAWVIQVLRKKHKVEAIRVHQ